MHLQLYFYICISFYPFPIQLPFHFIEMYLIFNAFTFCICILYFMFILFYAFYIWLYFVLMLLTGFDEINLDVHMECMSIVTDATQNQNGSTFTKSEIMVFLPEVALVNLSKWNNGILARVALEPPRLWNAWLMLRCIVIKSHSGKSVRMKSKTFPHSMRWNKVRTHPTAPDYEM